MIERPSLGLSAPDGAALTWLGVNPITFQAYIAAREAGLNPALAREVDGVPEGARLLLVPSVKALTAPAWRALEERARAGATVYVSFFPGTSGSQRGPWWPDLNARFGVEHRLRYGLVERVVDDVVTWRVTDPLGDLATGEELPFRVGGSEHSRALLPVTAPANGSGARVVATDGAGRPALLARDVGEGTLVLATYPIEHFAARSPAVNPEATWRLYRALGVRAGVDRAVRSRRPDVLVDRLLHRDGASYVWAVSACEGRVTAGIDLAGSGWLEDLETGERAGETVDLPPFGVRVFRWITQERSTR